MASLNEVARSIANEVKPVSDKVGFDFVTIIMMIIEILQSILPILEDFCNLDPEQVTARAKHPGPLQKIWLRWQARKVLGRSAYRAVGPAVVNGMLKVGGGLTADEIADLYNEQELILV